MTFPFVLCFDSILNVNFASKQNILNKIYYCAKAVKMSGSRTILEDLKDKVYV